MDGDITLFTLFLLGFFGGGHCVGMYGRLDSAFALQPLPGLNRAGLIMLLNLGRIGSCAFIGLLVGIIGQIGISLDQTRWLQNDLYLSTNPLLLFLGLYLAGISSLITRIESISRPVWKHLSPLLNRLLPVQSVPVYFNVGMLWGWLSCGLMYSASLYALDGGNTLESGLYMLAFVLGTLLNLSVMGPFAAQLENSLQRETVHLVAGLLITAWVLWRSMSFYVTF